MWLRLPIHMQVMTYVIVYTTTDVHRNLSPISVILNSLIVGSFTKNYLFNVHVKVLTLPTRHTTSQSSEKKNYVHYAKFMLIQVLRQAYLW